MIQRQVIHHLPHKKPHSFFYTTGTDQSFTPGCAPSVLIFFINMMLFKSQEPLDGCAEYMFEAQSILQKVLVFIALICVPIMLLGKPLYIQFTRKNNKAVNGGVNHEEVANSHGGGGGGHEEEEISEIYIHQAIHTIEYVLSTVSHTASYLRLWALSLAHARKYLLGFKLFCCNRER